MSITTDTTERPTVPPLTRPELGLAGFAALAAAGVGALGLASSFDAVSTAAARWGFGSPWMLPVGIDIAIPVFTVANLLLIRMDMALAWVRFVPWVLTLITCWLNVAAGHSLSAKVAHGTMPLLWVVFSEIGAHIYAVRIGAVTGRRMDKIRLSRWLLAFPSTFALWRRMALWEITSYADALEREKERQLARAQLREEHGRNWRRKAPRRTRVLLKLGELAPDSAIPAEADQDFSRPEPENTPEPSRSRRTPKPRAKTGKAGKSPRLSLEELLAKAREVTADWPYERLEAAPIREAVGCGQARSRELREALKAERQHGPTRVAA